MRIDPWAPLRTLAPELPWAALERLAGELARWNRRVRLVGPRDLDGVRAQIADALIPFLRFPPSGPLVDVGTGAGLPLLPVALAFPGLRVVGVEPRHKPAAFVRHAVRELGIGNAEFIQGRAPDVLAGRPDLRGAFASGTARAVADPATVLEWLGPFLGPGGTALLPRGADPAPEVPGWEKIRDEPYAGVPGMGPRRIAMYQKPPSASDQRTGSFPVP